MDSAFKCKYIIATYVVTKERAKICKGKPSPCMCDEPQAVMY